MGEILWVNFCRKINFSVGMSSFSLHTFEFPNVFGFVSWFRWGEIVTPGYVDRKTGQWLVEWELYNMKYSVLNEYIPQVPLGSRKGPDDQKVIGQVVCGIPGHGRWLRERKPCNHGKASNGLVRRCWAGVVVFPKGAAKGRRNWDDANWVLTHTGRWLIIIEN